MEKTLLVMRAASFVTLLLFSTGCGGGGGSKTLPSAAPTQAVVRLSTGGSPSVIPFVGAQATIHLPAGVTVRATTNTPQTDADVVVASGQAVPADLVVGVYSVAGGTVSAYVVKRAGFAVGEFATVNCDIMTGVSPRVFDFRVSDLIVSDADGNLIIGLTPSIMVSFE